MRILWITNIVFPEAQILLTGKNSSAVYGGWMLGAANALISRSGVELAIASPIQLVKSLTELQGKKMRYFLFPLGKGNLKKNDEYRKYWREIHNRFQPDIIHIHGTEFSHGLAYVDECGTDHVVVSIQGLVSVYERYYNYGLNNIDILKSITIRDIIRGTIFSQKRLFRKRGDNEIELLKKVQHIIGRTSWDKVHSWAINPNAKYHFCNETLRDEFYSGQWSYDNCVPHTIFISQANYPIKGFHQLLKSMPLILRHYPDTQIKVAGGNIINATNLRQSLLLSGYGKYLKCLIKHYGLKDHVVFLGSLNAEQMRQEFLHSNVFVCPSSIENSPNSLGEAQMLGVPVIASYVGGVPDMMKGDEVHMYRFDETEMLAYQIYQLFNEIEIDSSKMQGVAKVRHNPETNAKNLIDIYYQVSKNKI